MPAPIELIYRMTDRDAALPQWGFTVRTIIETDTTPTVQTTHAAFQALIPDGFLWNVTHCSADAVPKALDTGQAVQLIIVDAADAEVCAIKVLSRRQWPFAPSTDPDDHLRVESQVDLVFAGPDFAISAVNVMNGGAGNRSAILGVAGYLMPLGNFARF